MIYVASGFSRPVTLRLKAVASSAPCPLKRDQRTLERKGREARKASEHPDFLCDLCALCIQRRLELVLIPRRHATRLSVAKRRPLVTRGPCRRGGDRGPRRQRGDRRRVRCEH